MDEISSKYNFRNNQKFTSNRDDRLNFLLNVTKLLKTSTVINKEDALYLAGPSGVIIEIIEDTNISHSVLIQSLQALQSFLLLVQENYEKNKNSFTAQFPSEVISSIQRVILTLCKEEYNVCNRFDPEEYRVLLLSILEILHKLVLCFPREILTNLILNVSHKFIFYGLNIKSISFEEIPFTLDLNEICEEKGAPKPYTNRNRKKRLKRKKKNTTFSTVNEPISSQYSKGPSRVSSSHLDFSKLSINSENSNQKTETGEFHGHSRVNLNHEEHIPSSTMTRDSYTKGIEEKFINKKDGNQLVENFVIAPVSHNGESKFTSSFHNEDYKIRNAALLIVNTIIEKSNLQSKFGFWSQFICQKSSLMTLILRDSSSLVRLSALDVLSTFLMDSQTFLGSAIDRDSSSSFTSLGCQIGQSIQELHRCLSLALISEKKTDVLVKILKTVELLIVNVKYSSLRPGLLTKIITHVKPFLRYKEMVVRANAFSVMVSFLKIKPQPPEIENILTKFKRPYLKPSDERLDEKYDQFFEEESTSDEFVSSSSDMDESEEKETLVSWLLGRCIESFTDSRYDAMSGFYIQVQLQSLKVMSTLVSEYFFLVNENLSVIQNVVSLCVSSYSSSDRKNNLNFLGNGTSNCHDPCESVVEHAYLLLGSLMSSLKTKTEGEIEGQREEIITEEALVSLNQKALQLWLWALQNPLKFLLDISKNSSEAENGSAIAALRNEPVRLVVAATNVISQLSLHVLSSVDESTVSEVLTLSHLLLRCQDEHLILCGLRIIAIITSYEPVVEHVLLPDIFNEALNVCCQLLSADGSSSAANKDRIVASWALANLVSAAKSIISKNASCKEKELLTKDMYLIILRTSVAGCKDKDKIRPKAVRCIGHTISNIPLRLVSDKEIESQIQESVSALIQCCTTAKNMMLRWDSCGALGLVMTHPHLPFETLEWKKSVLFTLSSLVEQFSHNKVRIHAAKALCSIDKRSVYGSDFLMTWKSVLKGLDEAQSVLDIKATQHQKELNQQLCLTLSKLVSLLKLDDLADISESLILYEEVAKTVMNGVFPELSPNHSEPTLKASQNLKTLASSDALTATQNNVIEILINIIEI